MSVTSFGRALRSRRPSLHHNVSSASSTALLLVASRPSICCCQFDTMNGGQTTTSRSFSASTSHTGASKQQKRERQLVKTPLPNFRKTSNPKLDALLSSLHKDQFSIDHLPYQYRLLVTKSTKHHILNEAMQSKPGVARPRGVTVGVDGQSIPVEPVKHRINHSGKDLTKALNLMLEPSDYDIIIPLVEAMAFSKIHIEPYQWRKLVRACGLAGRPGVAMKIAYNCVLHRRNRFAYTRGTLRELIRAQMVRFIFPDQKHAVQAIKRARSMAGLAARFSNWYDTEQVRQRLKDRAPRWMTVDPVVLGTQLFYEAGKQVRWNEGKDFNDAVLNAVKLVKECWPLAQDEIADYAKSVKKEDAESQMTDDSGKVEEAQDYATARDAVQDWEPVLQGLLWAQDVLKTSETPDKDVQKWITGAVKTLRQAVDEWKLIGQTKGGSRLGIEIYEGAYTDLDGYFEKNLESKSAHVLEDKMGDLEVKKEAQENETRKGRRKKN